MEKFKPDSIVQTISQRFIDRAKMGKQKYNTDLDRTDLNPIEWLEHLQGEIHDSYVYSEKLKQDMQKMYELLELLIQHYNDEFNLGHLQLMKIEELIPWYNEQKEKIDRSRKRNEESGNSNY